MSLLNDILDAVVTEHEAVDPAPTIGGKPLTVVKRKLPKREETVDAAYQVTISGVLVPESVKRIARGKYMVMYAIEMTLITPNDHDAATNLPDHAAWRESTRARYMAATPLPTLATVKRIDVVTGPFLDRAMLAEGYDYDQIALNIWSYESR
jgi:hypothetical protein